MEFDMDLRRFRKKHALILAPDMDNDLFGAVPRQLDGLSLIQYKKDMMPYDTVTLVIPEAYANNDRILKYLARNQILPPTLFSVDKALEAMQKTTNQDLCHIIVCGHGGLVSDQIVGEIPLDSEIDRCIRLPDDLDTSKIYESSLHFSDGILTSSDLKAKISAMPAALLFMTGQCYGGNFAYNLLRSQGDTGMSGTQLNSMDIGLHFISKIPYNLYSIHPARSAYLQEYLTGYDAFYHPQYFVHDGRNVSVFNCSDIPRK